MTKRILWERSREIQVGVDSIVLLGEDYPKSSTVAGKLLAYASHDSNEEGECTRGCSRGFDAASGSAPGHPLDLPSRTRPGCVGGGTK